MCTQNSYNKICEECGKPFTTSMATTLYCSEKCSKLAYKHKKRDERLAGTTLEVREKQRLALLDKDFLTLTDAARLMQMFRNHLFCVLKDNDIERIKRGNFVYLPKEDVDRALAYRLDKIQQQ